MNSFAKWTIGLIGTGGLAAGLIYFLRLNKTQEAIDIIPAVNVHSLYPLTLRIDTLIKNPSKTGVTIKQPYVKLLYMDTVIGTSQSVDKTISIPAFGSVSLPEPIMLTIPLLGLFSIGATLLSDLKSGKAIKVKIQPYTYAKIGLGWKNIELQAQEAVIKNQTTAS